MAGIQPVYLKILAAKPVQYVAALFRKRPIWAVVFIIVLVVSLLSKIESSFAYGGKVLMPFEPTFWTPLFGMVTDKFGITWNLMQM